MELVWRTTLALIALTEVSSQYSHISPSPFFGVKGHTLRLNVKTHFLLEQAEVQGSWSHKRPSDDSNPLVSFNKDSSIINMMYLRRLRFSNHTLSLEIQNLTWEDEGEYRLQLNIQFHNQPGRVLKEAKTVQVTVDEPVSTPLVERSPAHAVVEDKVNVTWRCSVQRGTRVTFYWTKDNVRVVPSNRHHLSPDNSSLVISPARREDKGLYRCVAANAVSSSQRSATAELSVYYGPYDLAVQSAHALRTGQVFTINPGQLVHFECQGDSNPPNSYVWISKGHNGSQVIGEGPRLELLSYKLAQAEEYMCRAFNNITHKQEEAHFTLVVASLGTGPDKRIMDDSSVSSVAILTVCSLLIISCTLLLFLRKHCHPKRVIMRIYNRPHSEQKRPHRSAGHEDATEDFGIYEFISIPGRLESTQVSSRSLARLASVQDIHTTIYDVIRHVPDSPSHTLLK